MFAPTESSMAELTFVFLFRRARRFLGRRTRAGGWGSRCAGRRSSSSSSSSARHFVFLVVD